MSAKTPVKQKLAPAPKTLEEIRSEVAVKQKDLLDAKRGHKQGELANVRVLRSLRKDIARLKTAARKLELSSEKEK